MLTKEQVKEALVAKFGPENWSLIEEAISETMKDVSTQVVEMKSSIVRLEKEKGFLNRKLASQNKMMERRLQEKETEILSEAEEFIKDEIAKKDAIIESLSVKRENEVIELAKKAEAVLNNNVIPKVREIVAESEKSAKNETLVSKLSKMMTETLKRAKKVKSNSEEVDDLKEKVAKLQSATNGLVEENRRLKNRIVFLKETKSLKEEDAKEIEDEVRTKNFDTKKLMEAKKRVLERKRRSILRSKITESARQAEIERTQSVPSATALDENSTNRIIKLIED